MLNINNTIQILTEITTTYNYMIYSLPLYTTKQSVQVCNTRMAMGYHIKPFTHHFFAQNNVDDKMFFKLDAKGSSKSQV